MPTNQIDRKSYIGSTEVVALVEPDKSPFCSPFSIFLDKCGLSEKEEPSERMKAGKYLEKAILDEWNQRNARDFIFNDFPHFFAEGIGATVDGIEKLEGAEVKTVTRERRSDWDNGTPRYIWWQAQSEMLCSHLDRVVVIAQFGFDSLAHEWIERDEVACKKIVDACNEMWKRIRGELPPPEADGHPATTRALASRQLNAKVVQLSHDVQKWSDEAKLEAKLASACAAKSQALENKIRAAMGDATTGLFGDGTGYRITTINRKGYKVNPSSYQQMKFIKNKDSVEEQGDEQ